MVAVCKSGSPNEVWECRCLSRATIVESLESFVWLMLMYASVENEGEIAG